MVLLSASTASAGTDQYTITIQKVQLKSAAGDWITVIEPDRQVDLVNEEPSVSFFNSNGRVPEGQYVNFRVIFSESVRLAGNQKSARTRSGGRAVISGRASRHSELPGEITAFREQTPTWNTSAVGEMTLVFDLDGSDEDDVMTLSAKNDFARPVEVRAGSFVKVWFDVTVDDAVRHGFPGAFGEGIPARDVMYALPPDRIDELSLTVDQRTDVFTDRDVALEF